MPSSPLLKPGGPRGKGLRRAARVGRWLPVGVLVIAACGGGARPPVQPPPETVSQVEPTEAPSAAPAPPAATPEAPAAPQAPAPKVVIEPSDPEPDEQLTLAEAARRERERRSRTGEPIAVINDANLKDHAVGELTFIEDEAPAEESGEAEEGTAEGADEQYWRDRVREIRQRWADTAKQVPELEERVAELRRRFYDADDAYYRDTRIKPAWDRAIDQIAQRRAEAEAHRLELQKVLEEGRLAGALPGWLREGIELEPEPPEPEPDGHEPGEPTIVEPGEVGG